MGSSSQDLAGAMLIIFKRNSSVTGSKVGKEFPAKEVSGQAVGFGGEKLFLMVRIVFAELSQDGQVIGLESRTGAGGQERVIVFLSITQSTM